MEDKSDKMEYEDIYKYVGDLGKYQLRIFFVLGLFALPATFHNMSIVFLAAAPAHR